MTIFFDLCKSVAFENTMIRRLENGSSAPSLSFLNKIAAALDAKIEVRFVAESKETCHAKEDDS